mmetsp:Transcript_24769/g.98313  ORF Transcript_24769/g.98313 Transcript_24769/m.98313 type:complete len:213 (-) Transcript_24769:1060-1698(-)
MGGLRNVLSGFHRHSPRPHGSTPLATVSRRTACLGAQATRTRKCGHRVARPLRGRRGRATRRSASQGLARDDRGALVTEVSRADGLRVTNPTAALEMLTGGLGARVGRSGNDALRSMHAGAMSCTLRDLGRSREASPFAAESVELATSHHGPESSMTLNCGSLYAVLLADVGRVREGRAELERVLATQTRILGAEHPKSRHTKAALDALKNA